MVFINTFLKFMIIVSNKGPSSQSYGFSSSHAWMWELDFKEYWSGLPFPSPIDDIVSDLSTMTHLSWVAPHGMA